jgi:putative hydroxymethylpyrimidine transport system substrate-binding protein
MRLPLVSALRISAMVFAGLVAAAPVAKAADKLSIILDWNIGPDHAPLLIGQYAGYFKEKGLDVTLIEPSDPDAAPRLIAAKQADLALTFQPALYLLAEAHLPVVRIGALIDTPLNSLVALKGGPIKTLADFKGRKIGYSVAGVEPATINAMLSSAGVNPKDVTLVDLNFQVVTALLSHQVDGTFSAFRTFEVNEIKQKGGDPLVFFPEEHGVPMYDELAIIANRDSVTDPRLPRFFDAMEESTTFILNHPQEAWDLVIKNRPDFNNPTNKIAWFENLPRLDKDPRLLDAGRYKRFGDFLVKQGVIKQNPPLSEIAAQIP